MDRQTPKELAFEYELNRIASQILITIGDTEINRYHTNTFKRRLTDLIYCDDFDTTIEDWFGDCIGHGSFKECYESGIPGWVVKFYSAANNTSSEEYILRAAADRNVGHFFCPTYFLELPTKLNAQYLDQDSYTSYNEEYHTFETASGASSRYSSQDLIGIELQPQAITAYNFHGQDPNEDPGCSNWHQITDKLDLVIDTRGNRLTFDEYRDTAIESIGWIEQFLRVYGYDELQRLIDFVGSFNLSDLRSCNIGYLHTARCERLPVILDWLSGPIVQST